MLTPQESRALFETLRAMAADGRAIVFISHKLHEVLAVSDRITVLRGGRVVATLATDERDARGPGGADGRARGRDRRAAASARAELGDVVLEAHDLHAEGDRGVPALRGVSLAVRARRDRRRGRASPATASASWPRRSPGCAPLTPADA